MDILKNDVFTIISEKVNSKSARNVQSSYFQPGLDKQISKGLSVQWEYFNEQ